MKVRCPHCDKVYNISDDALPRGKSIAFHCKGCNGLIKIDLGSKAEKDIFPRMSRGAKAKKHVRPSAEKEDTEGQPKGRVLKGK